MFPAPINYQEQRIKIGCSLLNRVRQIKCVNLRLKMYVNSGGHKDVRQERDFKKVS